MSLTTPTIVEINNNIIAQLEAAFSQTIPLFPNSFLRVLAKTLAAVFMVVYKYTGFMFLQMFVQSATIDETEVNGTILSPLIEWGRMVGVGDPVAAVQAELQISIVVTNQTGSLSAGTQFINSDNGVTYLSTTAINLDAATKQVNIRASSDQSGGGGAGAIGNLENGAVVSFADPLPNVYRYAGVISTITAGSDQESTALYRQRILDWFQKRPQGGAYSDYEAWGKEVSGIINIYPYTSYTPGFIDVYAEATPASSGDPDGFPSAAQLTAVEESIQYDDAGLASRRPAGAYVNVYSITRLGFAVIVQGLVVEDTAVVQADITAAVEEYFLLAEPFIEGLSVPPRRDVISEAAVGGVVNDVVSAASGVFTGVELSFYSGPGTPINLYTLDTGEKTKAESVTFT